MSSSTGVSATAARSLDSGGPRPPRPRRLGLRRIGRRAFEPRYFELEAEAVEPAARGTMPVLEMRGGGMSGGSHVPRGEDQVTGPTRIAHAIGAGVAAHDERLLRALGDAGAIRLGAFRPDAEVVLRPQGEGVALGLLVHPVLAHLDAAAARRAAGQAIDLVLAQDVTIAIGGRADLPFDQYEALLGRDLDRDGGRLSIHTPTSDGDTRSRSPNASFSISSMKMARPTSPRRRRTSRMPIAPNTSINWLCQAPMRLTMRWAA